MSKFLKSLKEKAINEHGEKEGAIYFDQFLKPFASFFIEMKLIDYDLKQYSELFSTIIIPQAKEFNSKFSRNKIEDELFQSYSESAKNNEILSLAYIGLYHKIENYENRILHYYNLILESNIKKFECIDVDFNKSIFKERDRIRLICNSVKHNDCYPKKGLLKYYADLDLNAKLDLAKFNLQDDIKKLQLVLRTFNVLILFKLNEKYFANLESDEEFVKLVPEIKGMKDVCLKLFNKISDEKNYRLT